MGTLNGGAERRHCLAWCASGLRAGPVERYVTTVEHVVRCFQQSKLKASTFTRVRDTCAVLRPERRHLAADQQPHTAPAASWRRAAQTPRAGRAQRDQCRRTSRCQPSTRQHDRDWPNTHQRRPGPLHGTRVRVPGRATHRCSGRDDRATDSWLVGGVPRAASRRLVDLVELEHHATALRGRSYSTSQRSCRPPITPAPSSGLWYRPCGSTRSSTASRIASSDRVSSTVRTRPPTRRPSTRRRSVWVAAAPT